MFLFGAGREGNLLIVSQCGIHTRGASKLGAYEVFLLFAPLLIIAVLFSAVCLAWGFSLVDYFIVSLCSWFFNFFGLFSQGKVNGLSLVCFIIFLDLFWFPWYRVSFWSCVIHQKHSFSHFLWVYCDHPFCYRLFRLFIILLPPGYFCFFWNYMRGHASSGVHFVCPQEAFFVTTCSQYEEDRVDW